MEEFAIGKKASFLSSPASYCGEEGIAIEVRYPFAHLRESIYSGMIRTCQGENREREMFHGVLTGVSENAIRFPIRRQKEGTRWRRIQNRD
jgi:hypothetical protein